MQTIFFFYTDCSITPANNYVPMCMLELNFFLSTEDNNKVILDGKSNTLNVSINA